MESLHEIKTGLEAIIIQQEEVKENKKKKTTVKNPWTFDLSDSSHAKPLLEAVLEASEGRWK